MTHWGAWKGKGEECSMSGVPTIVTKKRAKLKPHVDQPRVKKIVLDQELVSIKNLVMLYY